MKLDGKEFDVPDKLFNEFFAVMDTFKKVILSKDSDPKTITDKDKSLYCLYEVANHIIGLPKKAKDELEDFLVYK